MWYLLIGLALVALVVYVLTRKNPQRSAAPRYKDGPAADKGANFLPPILEGFQIFEERLSVAGTQHRHDDASTFATDSAQALLLERDLSNPHDPNAIRVIGVGQTCRRFIGYVPKEVAEQIVGSGLSDVVQARLIRIWRSRKRYVDITFQIVGPKSSKATYDGFLQGKPADATQREFMRFFGLPVPKSLTAGEATTAILEHRKKLQADDPARLDEWDAFVEIFAEFDDADFRASYDLKKVSRALLREALDELQRGGATMRSLADDLDAVVEQIVALKPDIEKG
jgi:hypothetical protein